MGEGIDLLVNIAEVIFYPMVKIKLDPYQMLPIWDRILDGIKSWVWKAKLTLVDEKIEDFLWHLGADEFLKPGTKSTNYKEKDWFVWLYYIEKSSVW